MLQKPIFLVLPKHLKKKFTSKMQCQIECLPLALCLSLQVMQQSNRANMKRPEEIDTASFIFSSLFLVSSRIDSAKTKLNTSVNTS